MTATGRILILAGALIVVIVVAVGVLVMARRRLFGSGDGADSVGIPLHELRAMHSRGEIDDVEFEQLRTAALAEWGVKSGSRNPRINSEKSPPSTPENPSDGTTGN